MTLAFQYSTNASALGIRLMGKDETKTNVVALMFLVMDDKASVDFFFLIGRAAPLT